MAKPILCVDFWGRWRYRWMFSPPDSRQAAYLALKSRLADGPLIMMWNPAPPSWVETLFVDPDVKAVFCGMDMGAQPGEFVWHRDV